MPKNGRIFVNKSVSFPPRLLREAVERARKLGLPFSSYVQKIVERDLETRGAIVISEAGEESPKHRGGRRKRP